jgi:hypothetical protein
MRSSSFEPTWSDTPKDPTKLGPGRLFIVGEFHDESKPRRADEKKFVQAVTKSTDKTEYYWTEAGFPDLEVPANEAEMVGEKTERTGIPMADKGELRALNAAALLISHFNIMAGKGDELAGAWDLRTQVWGAQVGDDDPARPAVPAEHKATSRKGMAQIGAEVNKPWLDQATEVKEAFAAYEGLASHDLSRVVQDWQHLSRAWKTTDDSGVNAATRAVFENVDRALKHYLLSLHEATKILVGNRAALIDLMKSVASAAGQPGWNDQDPAGLADYLQLQRSANMAHAARHTKKTGVWKVGEAHITDMRSGGLAEGLSIVNRRDFNWQFEGWLSAQKQAEQPARNLSEQPARNKRATLQRSPAAREQGGRGGQPPVPPVQDGDQAADGPPQ